MQHSAIFIRIFAGVMLITAWGLTDSPLSGVVFVLILTALSAARYRLRLYKPLIPAEIIVCVVCAFVWLPALLGLWFPVIGLIENKWREWETELFQKDYEEKAKSLRRDKARENAISELQNAAKLAEISERARIAQDIHDHVGHEITGALIALQTAVKLLETDDKRAGELLKQTVMRLESASENLRDTVHNLKPAQIINSRRGVGALEALCDNFAFCGAEFSAAGDTDGIKTAHYELLAANLKEALTNVSRHSNATLVNVRLDCNEKFVRLTISDNGRAGRAAGVTPRLGMGLAGMKERVRAVNGTLTVSNDDGFKIICIIPKGEKA
jgi:signal transduction histidine kinase